MDPAYAVVWYRSKVSFTKQTAAEVRVLIDPNYGNNRPGCVIRESDGETVAEFADGTVTWFFEI